LGFGKGLTAVAKPLFARKPPKGYCSRPDSLIRPRAYFVSHTGLFRSGRTHDIEKTRPSKPIEKGTHKMTGEEMERAIAFVLEQQAQLNATVDRLAVKIDRN